ncbi:MAG: hypothetical protein ACYCYI_02925 [Saccharofermentanales bacterium]
MKNHSKSSSSLILFVIISLFTAVLLSVPVIAATPRSNNNTRVAVGEKHALLLDGEGNVWAFGNNDSRQLGDGTDVSRRDPVMVYHKSWKGRAVSIAAGSNQSLVLLENGTVLSWGNGSSEQKLLNLSNVTAISAGQDICMAILESGYVVVWSNTMDQQAVEDSDGFPMVNISEISVGSNDFIILRDGIEGYVYQIYNDDYTKAYKVAAKDSENLKDAVAIAAGSNFGLALLRSGDVCSWGASVNGVLGQGDVRDDHIAEARIIDNLSNVSRISAGKEHAITISDSNIASGWGNGGLRQLDSKTTGINTSPAVLNLGLANISQFDCGDTFNLALSTAGEFYTWGSSRGLEKLTLKQTFKKVPNPQIKSIDVKDKSISISWNTGDYYIEMSSGFLLTYTMPDGTTNRTQLLPLNISQITLLSLQAATNYRITLSVIGRTGYEDKMPAIVVQTAKLVELSPTPVQSKQSDINSKTSQPAASGNISGTASQNPAKGKITSLLSLIIIIIILLMLAAAVVVIIYVWKKMKKDNSPRFKSVRVSPEKTRKQPTEATVTADIVKTVTEVQKTETQKTEVQKIEMIPAAEVIDVPAIESPDVDIPLANEVELYESLIINQTDQAETAETEDIEEEELPELPPVDDDDDDDFITRKPGEPKSSE